MEDSKKRFRKSGLMAKYRTGYMRLAAFLFLISAAIIISPFVRGQDNARESITVDRSTADMDGDGVADTLRYNPADATLIFLLSSRGFAPGSYEFDYGADHCSVSALDGGFSVSAYYWRDSEVDWYRYDGEAGRFRWMENYVESFENAAGDGFGMMTLDLITGEFTGYWYYYGPGIDSVISLPPATVHVDNPPIYFGDSADFSYPGYELYDYYKRAYEPPRTVGTRR